MKRTLDDAVSLPAAGGRWFRILAATGVVGLAASGLLAVLSGDGGVRFYTFYLTSFVYFLTLALGALFFVLIQFATRAGEVSRAEGVRDDMHALQISDGNAGCGAPHASETHSARAWRQGEHSPRGARAARWSR